MTDGTTPWRGTAASRHAPVPPDGRKLTVYRGRVVSVADRVTSTTYAGKHSDHTTVNTVPEVWIADASGQELRFSDVTVAACRPGHDVVIIGDPAKDRVLGMGNLTTGQTWYAPTLAHLPVNFGHIWGMGVAALLFCGFAWFLSIAIFGEIRARHTWWDRTAPELMFYIALFFAWWVPERLRHWFNRRSEGLRALIDREIEAAGQST